MDVTDANDPNAGLTWREWLADREFLTLVFADSSDLPPALAEQLWAPSAADRSASWAFLIQLRSRIATQPLALRSGSETAVLDSVYKLFDLFRDIATRHMHASHFTALTLRLLNAKVRPFTSEWHRRKDEGDLASIDVCVLFRAQLSRLQCDLRKGAQLLATIAGVVLDDDAVHVRRTDLGFIDERVLLAQTPPSFAPSPGGQNAWRELFDSELEEIRKRRRNVAGSRKVAGEEATGPLYDGVGLALSGGGIRSATFSLGVVTELARRGILRQVDYLSTVSGGGYFGGFISTMLGNATNAQTADTDTFGVLGEADAKGPRALRNHSKYLIEGGAATIAGVVAMVIHGIATSLLLAAPAVIMLAVLLRLVASLGSTGLVLVCGGGAAAAAGYVATTLAQKRGSEAGEVVGMYLGLGGIAALLGGAITVGGIGGFDHAVAASGWLFIALIALAAAMLMTSATATLQRLLAALITTLLFVLCWGVVAWLVKFEWAEGSIAATIVLAAIGFGIYVFANRAVDLNAASPHRYYRRRLADTFLLQRRDDGSVLPAAGQKLSMLGASGAAPYHLVCAAVNLPGSPNPELRGRRADFFIFSKHACGSPLTGYTPTTAWEAANPDLTLATAVAVSGAAAAPNMGASDASRFRQLLALLNIRLSYWLRKPGIVEAMTPTRYFRHELRATMHEDLPHLCVSDGGHIENLGVYELLRRRCKFVICIDGEADPLRAFGGLLTLVQLARIDLGVRIDPDLTNLRIDTAGVGRSHFEQFRIDYGGGDIGVLLYVKASMTGNESEFLKRYRSDNPAFPHETTAQQLYSERQFEAYRALGEHIAGDLFREDLIGSWKSDETVAHWFSRLAEHLLPPRS